MLPTSIDISYAGRFESLLTYYETV